MRLDFFYAAVIALTLIVAAVFAGHPSTSTRPLSADPLQIGDRLRVSVPDLLAAGQTTTITPIVEDDGKIGLLCIKPVVANGLTADQLADNIAQAYSDAHRISNADVKVERIEHPSADALPRPPLHAGDFLSVRLWDLEGPGIETTLTRQMDDRGTIAIAHLKGRLPIAGLSERDAGRAVVKALEQQGVLANALVEVVRISK